MRPNRRAGVCFDALTSKRVHESTFSHDFARSMIESKSGSHFDSELVAAFLQVEIQFLAIRGHYAGAMAQADLSKKLAETPWAFFNSFHHLTS